MGVCGVSSGVFYVGIRRCLYRAVFDEVRSTTTGGIGALLLGRVHAEASVAPRTPASDIV